MVQHLEGGRRRPLRKPPAEEGQRPLRVRALGQPSGDRHRITFRAQRYQTVVDTVGVAEHLRAEALLRLGLARERLDDATSAESAALERRSSGRMEKVTSLLVRSHLQRQLAAGWRGAAALCALAWIVTRVGVAAVVRGVAQTIGGQLRRRRRSAASGGELATS